jgi:hypothetical protein
MAHPGLHSLEDAMSDQALSHPLPAATLAISRTWRTEDRITVVLDGLIFAQPAIR